jgi:hypothetical protein
VLIAGVVLALLMGAGLGAVLTGAMQLGSGHGVALFVIGVNAVPWVGIVAFALLAAAERRRVAGKGSGRTERAPARIESSAAVGEGPNLPLRLDLTVAPETGPAFRVEAHAAVNIMDLDRFRAGGTVLVEYDPERRWDVRVRHQTGGDRAGRLALVKIDSVPPAARVTRPAAERRRTVRLGLLCGAVGFAASLPLWWALRSPWH